MFWEQPLLGCAVLPDSDIAIWDVTRRSGWAGFAGETVMDVQLDYKPQDGGFWCPRATVGFARGTVELLMGEARAPGWTLQPSADNIAVVYRQPPVTA
ncbi:hypothetical protein GCM10020218_050750 [Dactylosporangium vinaceum]